MSLKETILKAFKKIIIYLKKEKRPEVRGTFLERLPFRKTVRNGCKCAERQINGAGVIPDRHKFWRSAREVISMEEINERHCGYLICIDTDGRNRPLIRFLKSTTDIMVEQYAWTRHREKKAGGKLKIVQWN
ncbi:hypothetical protein NPIL_608861 [Nephila pilipes]|uniref:Uncharacterized protein n=1 Tax=Nephila pilipes TaxID=299642 RepID=A0A8X6KQX5_NEPPI|nr:hypothetical protein NPIL_608861 [Nephila pilipes]